MGSILYPFCRVGQCGFEQLNITAASPTAMHEPGVETRLRILIFLRGRLGGKESTLFFTVVQCQLKK